MNFNLQKFSADVKEFRKANKLTQSEFAGKLELDNHTLVSLLSRANGLLQKKCLQIIAELQAAVQKSIGKQLTKCRQRI